MTAILPAADLDIIIVNHNTSSDLQACLASLASAPPAVSHHICVVDNASADDSVARVRSQWPGVEVLSLSENGGFAHANNIGIRGTSARLMLLLNSDTLVPAGAIDRLIDRLEATAAVVAGPRLVDGTGRPEISWGPMLSPLGEARQLFRVRLAASRASWAQRSVERLLSREREVDWVSGACLLVRRAAAESAGLLDERFFMYEEDVDFCAAIRANGGTVVYTPAAHVVHLRGRSVAAAGRPVAPWYDRSHVLFYEKHAPRWAPVLRIWLATRGRAIR
ncbi:MAG: glycosyltransferase family 2 protein [Acidobacteria bacterium]|jgi:N-acetylglucosaminyl-diphospho-decaprenol L-rhamnosyltransferase|nr:glycosyltransferase family 2 protein [Acidobacteriota bacterium]